MHWIEIEARGRKRVARLSITAGQLTGASPGTTRFCHIIRRVKSYCRVSGGNGSVRSFNTRCTGAPC